MNYRRTVSYPTQPNRDDETHVFPITALPPEDFIRKGFESGQLDEGVKKLKDGTVITYTKMEET